MTDINTLDWVKIVKKPFNKWTVEEKVYFLHELLDHFFRTQYTTVPELGVRMAHERIVAVNYTDDDRFEYNLNLTK